ncbi:hypothetical protein ACKWTF_015212 [Chironomus riparius]
MEVKASYKIIEVDVSKHYHCIVKGQLIPENQELNFNGQHEEGNTNEDVTRNSTVNKVPQGLKNVFPNMKILWIMNSKLKKISKDDLKEYKNLTELRCSVNELEYLPGDLFDDFKDLKWIAFNDNNLRVVEPNILDKLDNLIHVDFRNNPQYGKWFSNHRNYSAHGKIDHVKLELINKYPEWLQKIKKISTKFDQRQSATSEHKVETGN